MKARNITARLIFGLLTDAGKSRILVYHMNINNINVNKYPISQMFDPDSKTVFEVPKYQREYVWGTREWMALYDDIVDNDEGYFLGSIICINSSSNSLNPKFEVVDGQQRLTTISLFMAALFDVLKQQKDLGALDDEQTLDLLQLRRKLCIKGANPSLRVMPQIQGNNLSDYRGLMSSVGLIDGFPMPSYAGLRRIVKAYTYFKKRIEADTVGSEMAVQAYFRILEKLNAAILVMIEVSNHADAYTLFESLNNRGMPLTSVDLIKNLLLARLDMTDSAGLDEHFRRWRQVLDNLGEDYATQERFFRQNYNAFRTTMNLPFRREGDERQYPLGAIVTRSNLLAVYEKLVTHSPVHFLNEIMEHSALYSMVILRNTEGLSSVFRESLSDLQRIQGAPAYLLLMYLLKNKSELLLDEEMLVTVVRLLVNFFIRRNITDTPPTRDLTRLFMAYIEEMEQREYKGEQIYVSLREKLLSVSSSESVFAETLRGPVYAENTWATRFILCMLAKQGMTRETEVDLWQQSESKQYKWSIEHIFPQGENIPASWVDMMANGNREEAEQLRQKYVHTLGNLTITAYNSTLGNKSFQEKRDRTDNAGRYIGYRNGLNLNADLVNKERWSEECIIERTERLVQSALQLFRI